MAYLKDILDQESFEAERKKLQELLEKDTELYLELMTIFVKLMKYKYLYQKNWLGIPIIKLPEDIIVLQEFYFSYKPTAVIEIGVARGGGVALAVSLQKLIGIKPRVLGIDISIRSHTHTALEELVRAGQVSLIEADSISQSSINAIRDFVKAHSKVFVTLDGNHSHVHVLAELKALDEILPVGSVVLVADGIIDYLPDTVDRPWGKGNSPLTALKEFLGDNANWREFSEYSKRSIFSEFRDGWIEKIA